MIYFSNQSGYYVNRVVIVKPEYSLVTVLKVIILEFSKRT